MNFFKKWVVLSAIFLASNIHAMEKERIFYAYVTANTNPYYSEYEYGSKSNDDIFNRANLNIDLFSASFNTNGDNSIPQKSTYINQGQQDSAENSRREQMADEQKNSSSHYDQQHNVNTENFQQQDLAQVDVTLQANVIVNVPLLEAVEELANNVKSPTYRAKLVEQIMILKNEQQNQSIRDYLSSNVQKQIDFLDALLDGSIDQILATIQKGDLKEAQKAFGQLKNMWPWSHKESFLTNQHTSKPREFIEFIGTDIMQVAESSLVSRKDYLESCDKSFLDKLVRYQKMVLSKQLQGDTLFLQREVSILSSHVLHNPKSNVCPLEKAMLVTVKSILDNPVTHILSTIKNANFDAASKAFGNFQMRCLKHFEGQPYKTMKEAKADLIEREGIDLLAAANKCFKSRSDYQEKMAQQKLAEFQQVNIDAFDMVSTTVHNSTITITPEFNQRIAGTLNTLNDQSLQSVSSYINTLDATLNKEQLDTGTQSRCFAIGLESFTLLQRYIENPNKQIVAEQNKNQQIFNDRKDALNFVSQNPRIYREQTYTLKPEAYDILRLYNIDPEKYTDCFGNEVRHQLRSEYVSLLNDIVEIPLNEYTQRWLDTIVTCTQAGNTYAQQNDMTKAFLLADCAWAALDCAKELGDDETNIARQAYTDIAEGIINGCTNVSHMVTHPRETLYNMGAALGHFTLCLMEFAYLTDDEFLTLDNSKTIEENAQRWQEKVNTVIDTTKQITLKGATAFVTEQIVFGQIVNLGIGAIKHCAQPSAIQLARLGKAAANKLPKMASPICETLANKLRRFVEPSPGMVTAEGVKVSVSKLNIAEDLSAENSIISKMETQSGSQAVKNATVMAEKQAITSSLAEVRQAILKGERRPTPDDLKTLGFHGDVLDRIVDINTTTGRIRLNTELQGGLEKAQEVFDMLKKEFSCRNLVKQDSEIIDGIQRTFFQFEDGSNIQIRTLGDSGHPKIEITDVFKNIKEKITFK